MPAAALVANTDARWFRFFRPDDQTTLVDEVNFWRPQAQTRFGALPTGGPFFFRLKHPINAIAGFGFFAGESQVSISLAWDLFGMRNGDPTFDAFLSRIAGYRRITPAGYDALARQTISCLILRDAVFLPESEWIPWGRDAEWQPNIVTYKGYPLDAGPGRLLASLLQQRHPTPVPDLEPVFIPLLTDERQSIIQEVMVREGQGTFRARLLTAYSGRCAATGERSVPALDAAHIQPYRGPASNHIQNGLLLRADLHRLYDTGYLTVTPDLRLEVSGRLWDEFENGRAYYALAGQHIRVPEKQALQPSPVALEWHASHVFR